MALPSKTSSSAIIRSCRNCRTLDGRHPSEPLTQKEFLMAEAVIVATARSPIGRAYKGSLKDMRPDDLTAQMVVAAIAKVPALDPRDIEDLILGCGQPAGESGYN